MVHGLHVINTTAVPVVDVDAVIRVILDVWLELAGDLNEPLKQLPDGIW